MIGAWIPPSANAVKDFEGHDSVTLVYYLGTCLAAGRAAARGAALSCAGRLLRLPARPDPQSAIAPCCRFHWPYRKPQTRSPAPRTYSGRNGCRTGALCWPRGRRGALAARRLRAGGAAVRLPWSIQWADRGRDICLHHGGPVGRLYPASSHPPRPGAAWLRHPGAPNHAC